MRVVVVMRDSRGLVTTVAWNALAYLLLRPLGVSTHTHWDQSHGTALPSNPHEDGDGGGGA